LASVLKIQRQGGGNKSSCKTIYHDRGLFAIWNHDAYYLDAQTQYTDDTHSLAFGGQGL
jgi:hypothetical protein